MFSQPNALRKKEHLGRKKKEYGGVHPITYFPCLERQQFKSYVSKAKEVLGTKTQRREETWFDEECKQAIQERNKAHKNYILRRTRERKTEFENKRRRADKLCRQKKRKYENQRIPNIEREFKENKTRNAYQFIKHLRQGYKPKTSLCKNKKGEIISDMDEIKVTWMTYFKEVLNKGAQSPLQQQRQQQARQEVQQQELGEDGEEN
uniref:Uncharacterized protein LOC114332962 n=1 Tax=Diabrotica virgifera virgifera TaxID=50390 RepID=A0A6P7G1Q3_DIAVI